MGLRFTMNIKSKLIRSVYRWSERRSLFWWMPDNGLDNVGDYLSRSIVTSMLHLRDGEIVEKLNGSNRIFAIGSILHFAKTGDCVWGSGLNSKVKQSMHRFDTLDVRAVRGPITRDFLLKRSIPVPEVYGDPALLMPLFAPRDLLVDKLSKNKDFLIVPHFSEDLSRYRGFEHLLVSPLCRPTNFVRQLLTANLIISSSLHGLIISEAYGIPSIYLDWGNGEAISKYHDYYLGTGREEFLSSNSIEGCVKKGGNSLVDFSQIQRQLINSFPYDLWGI